MLQVKVLAGLVAPICVGGYLALHHFQGSAGPQEPAAGKFSPVSSGVDKNNQPIRADLAFVSQSYRNGKIWAINPMSQRAGFSRPSVDQVDLNGKRLELVLIPRGKPGDYSCDVKETLTEDPDGDTWSTLREKMNAPILGSYKWQPGQTVFITLSPPPNGSFHVYDSESAIPRGERAIYFRVQFTAKPGVKEDPNFWNTHVISGRYDDQIIDAAPVTVALDLRFTQDGKVLAHQQLEASNDKPGTFVVRRPDGIRSEITFYPEMVGKNPFVQWDWLEFREIPRPGDRRSGHGSLGGESSCFQPLVGRVQVLRFYDHYDSPTDRVCEVKVLQASDRMKP